MGKRLNPRKGEHMSKPTGGPAFPTKPGHWMEEGMTLRDYFAAKAIAGVLSAGGNYPSSLARHAYEIADAMLAEKWREEE